MRIAILTGGGDVPGLNPCIRALTYRGIDGGHEVIGIRRGWWGLLAHDPNQDIEGSEHMSLLTKAQVRTVDRFGGTFLHTSRTNPGRVRDQELPPSLRPEYEEALKKGTVDATPTILGNIESLGLDVVVAIGGDDTLSYAVRLEEEGVATIGIPKTMDNDVYGTDYCIGFSTAITRSVNFVNALRTPAGSHERIAVIELFGRYCGETALLTGYLSSADRTVISEVPFDLEKLTSLLVSDRASNPSLYSVLVVSEGAKPIDGEMILSGEADAYGHKKLGGIGDAIARGIERISGELTMCQRLAYLMRAGAPDSVDRLVAYNYGNLAYELIEEKSFGQMVAIRNGVYTTVGLEVTQQGRRKVDVETLYDTNAYRPKITSVRGKPLYLH